MVRGESDRNRRGGAGGLRGGSGREGARPRFDDDEEEDYQDPREDYEEEGPRRPTGARPGRAMRKKKPTAKRRSFWGLFGLGAAPRRQVRRNERMDWESAQDEEDDDSRSGGREGYGREREEWDEPQGRRRSPARRERKRERLSLMDLCTPVFGYAAVLPRASEGSHPDYAQFRQEVLAALEKIESEAPEHGIEHEDAMEACYALSLFLDEQVAESDWVAKSQWAGEPLSVVRLQDPAGGANFFTRLESLGERQKDVREVFLLCLSLGFRGKYIDLEPTQQAAKLGEIRQKILRSIHARPLDSREVLFPEAYEPAEPLENEAPPPPRWWLFASLGAVGLAIIIYVVLYVAAGNSPKAASQALDSSNVGASR